MVGSELTTWVVPSARCPNGCGLREPQFHAAQRAQCGTSGTVLWKRHRLPGDAAVGWDIRWDGWNGGFDAHILVIWLWKSALYIQYYIYISIYIYLSIHICICIYIYVYLYIYVCVSVCVLQHVVTLKQHMFRLAWGNCPCGFAWGDSNGSLAVLWRLMRFFFGGYTTNHDHMMVS